MKTFTKQYNISKTLRFALQPVGRTREHIQSYLDSDESIASKYESAKTIMDDYHRFFIEKVLSENALISETELIAAYSLYVVDGKNFQTYLKELCKKIGKIFSEENKKFEAYGKSDKLLGKVSEWIQANFPEKEANLKLETISSFKNFSTYFRGFDDNRKNIYSSDDKRGSIAHRICENLQRFFDNCRTFEKHKSDLFDILKDFTDIFNPQNFSKFLSQSQIDVYNQKIGANSDQSTAKKGVNQLINEYRQKRGIKLPFMKELYKQVLSYSDSVFKLNAFSSDKECLEAVKSWWDKYSNLLIDFTGYLDANLNQDTYVKVSTLQSLSNDFYEDWSFIGNALGLNFTKNKTQPKAIKLSELNGALSDYIKSNDFDVSNDSILDLIKNSYKEFFKSIRTQYESVENILSQDELHKGKKRDEELDILKAFLDSILSFVGFLDCLYMVSEFKKITDIETSDFYAEFEKQYEDLRTIFNLYNKVRNYATKKPFSSEKFKLNFDNAQLLGGWDLYKEPDHRGVIFMKENDYYIGIINKKSNKIFDYRIKDDDKQDAVKKKQELQKQCLATEGEEYFTKLVYKLIPDPSKMLPKVFFSKKGINRYKPSQEVITIYNSKSFKTNISDTHLLIEYYQRAISEHEWPKFFKFEFKSPNEYESYSEFLNDVERTSYKLEFDKIKSSYIETLVDTGKLFLFKIYSKDFSAYSKGKPNLHTLYWKAIFESENLKDLVVKLNGKAEIFYRKASITDSADIVTHKANQPLKNKNLLTVDSRNIDSKKTSTFAYDIIKDRRYTKEHFEFHCPITLNAKTFENGENASKFNQKVNEFLKGNKDINIIGIDRGERHLLYYSIINQNGVILKQGSFNVLDTDKNYKVDYNKLLSKKAEGMQSSRKDWKSISGIKDLKAGYLSHIVYTLAILMLENNAVIAIEDLNSGFKNSRKRIEKSIYQNFEKALIDKLNYLVFKGKSATEAGGYLNAFQFTSKFISFEKLKRQCGFLFYVPASNTSKIDPVTGFINTLYPKYESVEKSKKFFSCFNSIKYNKENDYFEFSYNVENFTSDKKSDVKLNKTNWTVCSFGKSRYDTTKPDKSTSIVTLEVNVTENLKDLFSRNGIDFAGGSDIKNQITNNSEKSFFSSLLWNLSVLLKMRYTHKTEAGIEDYILSPVSNKFGEFFDSRKKYDKTLPQDADANGAYNIARKCLYIIHNITDDFKLPKTMSKVEWMNYTQIDV